MKQDDQGAPELGETPRTLGARLGTDVRVRGGNSVILELSGISVSPMPPENLPMHRRSSQFGGTGKDPVFEIETDELPDSLIYRPDLRKRDTHGYIGPAYDMTFKRYQQFLHETRDLWQLV